MSEFQKRVLTGVVGVIILGLVLYLGNIFLKVGILLLSLGMVRELSNALKNIDIGLNTKVLYFGAILTFIFSILKIRLEIVILIVFLILAADMVFTTMELNTSVYTIFSCIYGVYIINLLQYLEGTPLLYFVFLVGFSTDTFAYLVGSKFGRHKLIPSVSPNKSVEGAIGGVLGATILGVVFFHYTNIEISIVSILLVVFSSVFAQVGDLFASKIKRLCGIKDYSQILPGHGGLLDRFDSILFIIPLTYMLFLITF